MGRKKPTRSKQIQQKKAGKKFKRQECFVIAWWHDRWCILFPVFTCGTSELKTLTLTTDHFTHWFCLCCAHQNLATLPLWSSLLELLPLTPWNHIIFKTSASTAPEIIWCPLSTSNITCFSSSVIFTAAYRSGSLYNSYLSETSFPSVKQFQRMYTIVRVGRGVLICLFSGRSKMF